MRGQRAELGRSERLGAPLGVYAAAVDLGRRQPGPQPVAQGLAPLGERRRHQRSQRIAVAVGKTRLPAGPHPHHRGPYRRRRLERAGPHLEQRLDLGLRGQHHRQPAILLAAGCGRHAVDHLLLQHEVHVGDGRLLVQKMEQQRRGYVVGQVAHHAQRRARAAQAFEVGFQHVADMDAQPARALIFAQALREVAVDFHHVQLSRPLQQRPGQRAPARAHLENALAGPRIHRIQNPADHAGVVQEVLAEALTGQHVGHRRRPGSPPVRAPRAGCRCRHGRCGPAAAPCRDPRWCAQWAARASRSRCRRSPRA